LKNNKRREKWVVTLGYERDINGRKGGKVEGKQKQGRRKEYIYMLHIPTYIIPYIQKDSVIAQASGSPA